MYIYIYMYIYWNYPVDTEKKTRLLPYIPYWIKPHHFSSAGPPGAAQKKTGLFTARRFGFRKRGLGHSTNSRSTWCRCPSSESRSADTLDWDQGKFSPETHGF